jgi:hypothetical protein
MTFVEAAIEVLKREGKPLDARRLAELAVKHNLLSVVGRDPVGTMEERLEDALEKPDPRLLLFEVKKGVYGLRVYPPRPYPGQAPAGATKGNGHAAAAAAEGAAGEAAAEGEAKPAEARGEAGEEGKEKKRRRRGRRGGRGRKRGPEGAVGQAAGAAEAEGGEGEELETESEAEAELEAEGAPEAELEAEGAPEAQAEEGAGAEPEARAEAEAGEVGAGEEKRSRRRSRRGGRGRREEDREAPEPKTMELARPLVAEPMAEPEIVPEGAIPGETTEVVLEPAESELLLEEAAAEVAEVGHIDEDLEEDDGIIGEELADEEFDLPGGPLLAPTHGSEEVARSDEERTVRAEILGRRDERGRHPRRDRRREREERRDKRKERGGQAPERGDRGERPAATTAQAAAPSGPAATPGATIDRAHRERREAGGNVIDVILEVLRGSDGKPMHVRHMADVALKRQLVSGGHGDVVRQFRAALVREQRDREADGLRARVRALGGGHYAPADRKLDQELVPLERDLAQAAQKLRDATHAAVRRRIQRLPPPAFEALGRSLLDKLGLTGVELVRRGEGVAYYGGQKQLGVSTVRTLVAMRPGEGEFGRRAIGELRAGLAAKGYDEGLLLAAGRANAEAVAELKNGGAVVAHDGDSMASLSIRHGLGVRRVQMPVDYLDLELFTELTEA